MIYKLIEPPKYIDKFGLKRKIIKIVVAIIVSVIIASLEMAQLLPSKDMYYDMFEDKQIAERYYRENWKESFVANCGSCLLKSVIFGVFVLYLLSPIPDKSYFKNIKHFNRHYNFPEDIFAAALIYKTHKIPDVDMVVWKNENEIHMVANKYQNDFGKVIIPFENIVFFAHDGDFYTKTEINRNGRIIGGLITGTTVFFTKTNTTEKVAKWIKSPTILYLEEDGNEEIWFFNYETYNSLMQIIPQFEYKKVVSKPINSEVAPTSIF